MSPRIEMMQRIPPNKSLPVLRIRIPPISSSASRRARTRRRRTGFPSCKPIALSTGRTIPALIVETRRRTVERGAPLAEPACWARPCVAAVAAHWVGVGMAGAGGGVDLVEAVVAVVDGALGGVA
jgi:hypothetical protein